MSRTSSSTHRGPQGSVISLWSRKESKMVRSTCLVSPSRTSSASSTKHPESCGQEDKTDQRRKFVTSQPEHEPSKSAYERVVDSLSNPFQTRSERVGASQYRDITRCIAQDSRIGRSITRSATGIKQSEGNCALTISSHPLLASGPNLYRQFASQITGDHHKAKYSLRTTGGPPTRRLPFDHNGRRAIIEFKSRSISTSQQAAFAMNSRAG